MKEVKVGDILLRAKGTGIELRDTVQGTTVAVWSGDEVSRLIEFLTFQAEANAVEQRRSYRLTVQPGDISVSIATSSEQTIDADAVDISLGGMLVSVDIATAASLSAGVVCLVRLNVDGNVAELNSEVVRVLDDRLALRFVDCETDGEMTPSVELMRIYAEIQRRWLARRVTR